jgi:hypothetical protein
VTAKSALPSQRRSLTASPLSSEQRAAVDIALAQRRDALRAQGVRLAGLHQADLHRGLAQPAPIAPLRVTCRTSEQRTVAVGEGGKITATKNRWPVGRTRMKFPDSSSQNPRRKKVSVHLRTLISTLASNSVFCRRFGRTWLAKSRRRPTVTSSLRSTSTSSPHAGRRMRSSNKTAAANSRLAMGKNCPMQRSASDGERKLVNIGADSARMPSPVPTEPLTRKCHL